MGEAVSGRFRLDHYVKDEVSVGGDEPGVDLFETAEAAVEAWLLYAWEHDGVDNAAEDLLTEAAVIVDQEAGRVVAVVAFRGAHPGESRLPAAVVFDVATGSTRTTTIEASDE